MLLLKRSLSIYLLNISEFPVNIFLNEKLTSISGTYCNYYYIKQKCLFCHIDIIYLINNITIKILFIMNHIK